MAGEDAELEEIRRQKLSELQRSQAEKAKNEEIISQLRKGAQLFLEPAAANRLDNVRLVNPAKAARAEGYILQNLVRTGRITQSKKLKDEELKVILKQMEPPRREPTIRRA